MAIGKAFQAMEKALDIFHDGRMTVEVVDGYTTDDRFTEVENVVTIYEDLPCHLSFNTTSTEEEYKATNKSGEMVLFTAPTKLIPTNSRITVLQNGIEYIVTNDKVKAYKSHYEYEVKEFERWSEY